MTIIVAELGINHNGDFDLLIRLAEKAYECGVDYVKLQTRTPELCVPKAQWSKPKEWFDGSIITYIEYKKRMELTDEQLVMFDNHIRSMRFEWFSSVWDEPSLGRVVKFKPQYVKVPSAKITEKSLVDLVMTASVNERFVPVFSTGMSTLEEVKNLAEWIQFPARKSVVMACNSSYPTADGDVNLASMNVLAQMFRGHNIGYSSHHTSPMIPVYASLLGAKMVEVHFTLDRAQKGSDHAASLEPKGMELLVREIRRLKTLIGDGGIGVTESEKSPREKLRGA